MVNVTPYQKLSELSGQRVLVKHRSGLMESFDMVDLVAHDTSGRILYLVLRPPTGGGLVYKNWDVIDSVYIDKPIKTPVKD